MHSEIVIIGGGLNGLICALALANLNFEVTLIEKKDIASIAAELPDGRAYALSSGSVSILNSFNLWQYLQEEAGPINKIHVTDNHSQFFLDFDSKSLDDDEPLGYMIYSHMIYKNLAREALHHPKLHLRSPAIYKNIVKNPHKLSIEMDDGCIIDCSLLIAADGKHSPLRSLFSIESWQGNYTQSAIVCTIAHNLHHQHIAQEKFFSVGPFATLPLKDGFHSSIVWTEPHKLAKLLMKMPEDEFSYFLEQKFGDYLGKLTVIDKKFSYPLSYCLAKKYYAENMVLIGDSAHSIHPLAGQGLNLGISDIAVLVDKLSKARSLGLDLGSTLLLESYQKTRRSSNMAMFTITDSLNDLFTCDFFPIPYLRKIGLAGVNQLNSLKKFFMQYAKGK